MTCKYRGLQINFFFQEQINDQGFTKSPDFYFIHLPGNLIAATASTRLNTPT
jgi:hypothetical protein